LFWGYQTFLHACFYSYIANRLGDVLVSLAICLDAFVALVLRPTGRFETTMVHIPGVPCCFSLSPICPDGLHRVPAEKVFEAQKAPNIVSEGVIGTLVIDHD